MTDAVTIPIYLVFSGRRPLWCSPGFNLYDNNFDEESSKIYGDWVARRGGKKIAKRKKQFKATEDQGKPPVKVAHYKLDRFNITDGHNRTGILAKKGRAQLTLICSPEIRKLWEERTERVKKAFQEIVAVHSKPKLYQPVDMVPVNPTERSSYDRIKLIAKAMHLPETYQLQPKKTKPHDLEPKKILDIGCNMGFFTNWLSRMNHEAIGIDASVNKISFSNKLKAAYDLPTTFHNTTFQDFKEEVDGMLDLSCCWHLVWKKGRDNKNKMSKGEFADKLNKQCRGFLIAEVKSPFLDQYIELVTTKTHLVNMSVLGSTKYFQDPGGRKLVLFTAKGAIYPIPA